MKMLIVLALVFATAAHAAPSEELKRIKAERAQIRAELRILQAQEKERRAVARLEQAREGLRKDREKLDRLRPVQRGEAPPERGEEI